MIHDSADIAVLHVSKTKSVVRFKQKLKKHMNGGRMKKARLQWHVGFCAAMRTELEKYAENLEVISEYNLTKKPLQLDLLIVRKRGGPEYANNGPERGGNPGILGRLLSEHTLFEYKGPGDSLEIDDFYKVMAYAGLYKYMAKDTNRILPEQISVVFVVTQKPVNLLKHLEKYYKIKERELQKHVFILEGPVLFRSYLVIAGKGSDGNQDFPWLNALTGNLTEKDKGFVRKMLDVYGEQKDSDREAVMDLFLRANEQIVNEIKEEHTMCQALLELMAPEIEAAKKAAAIEGMAKGIAEGKAEGESSHAYTVVKNMFARGFSAEDAAGIAEVKLEQVVQWFAEWSRQ